MVEVKVTLSDEMVKFLEGIYETQQKLAVAAERCYNLGWGKWSPPSNQILGMALCWRAAQLLGEDYEKEPWN